MELIERSYGELTTLETRHDSYEMLIHHSTMNKRYAQIVDILDHSNPMTISEMVHEMVRLGYVAEPNRNHVAPRVHELMEKGLVEPCGKRKDSNTGRTVAVFRLTEEWWC